MKGGIRPEAETRSPAWTCPRWASSPTPSSSSPSRSVASNGGERRSSAPPAARTTTAVTPWSDPVDPGGHGRRARPVRAPHARRTGDRMDIAEILRDILIVLVAAKVAAELAERIGVPAVVGEIVAGILIGPSVLGLVGGRRGAADARRDRRDPPPARGRPGDGPRRAGPGRPGVAAGRHRRGGRPDGAGPRRHARWSASDGNTALFVGAALTATSVGITARVFGDLRALATTEARIVLGAAVADDVMGLVVLTVVVRLVTEGSVSACRSRGSSPSPCSSWSSAASSACASPARCSG